MTASNIECRSRGNSRDTMKFIKNDQMKSENLNLGDIIEPNEHADFWHHEIVDRAGEVYIGVVHDDGTVETATQNGTALILSSVSRCGLSCTIIAVMYRNPTLEPGH